MALPTLPSGKKRYSVSLTQEKVEKFQSLCRDLGMPLRVMSEVCDDALDNMSAYFQIVKQEGVTGYAQVMRVMAKQIELFEKNQLEGENSNASKITDSAISKKLV